MTKSNKHMAHLHCFNFIDREKLLVINILLKMSSVSKLIFSNIIDRGKRIISDTVFNESNIIFYQIRLQINYCIDANEKHL